MISSNKLKEIAAIKWCEDNGYEFRYVDEEYFISIKDEIMNSNLPDIVKKRVNRL